MLRAKNILAEVVALKNKLFVDKNMVKRCRNAAKNIADSIQGHIELNTTVSVERTVLRLLGIDGVDNDGVPLPNIIIKQAQDEGILTKGIAFWLGNAMVTTGNSPQEIADRINAGGLSLKEVPLSSLSIIKSTMEKYVEGACQTIVTKREERQELMEIYPRGPQPWLYVIVATGNIYDDVVQAKVAARNGADIIAVIRTTAQSLLDYVPYGATREGFGGTYATQENFKIMRKALDEVSCELGRYISLVNYSSGLCMPEIAAMGALERLDMLLNDAMYGILFRDINMKRTFVDQYFSRMISAYAGIIINTGEDNYLTTSDAVEKGHTVLASQFINEELAFRSGLKSWQMGLGHAFEIDPDLEDGFLLEIAQAQLIRQIFPDSPLKYMPPTKYVSGDIFKGHLMNGMFNFVSILTGQGIQLLGMLTEAIHTPFMHDRTLSIENARYIFNNARNIHDEIMISPKGKIQRRASEVLSATTALLESIAEIGLPQAIAAGMFADITRSEDGGKGYGGLIEKDKDYYNPFLDYFKKELKI